MFSYDRENIVAIATPPGVGALAIVRISGGGLKQLYKDLTHKIPLNRKKFILLAIIICFFR